MLRDGFKVDLKTGYEINKQTIVSINIIVKKLSWSSLHNWKYNSL